MGILKIFGRPGKGAATGPPTWLIVGLGNPGREYKDNRHNVGFKVVERLATTEGFEFDERRDRAVMARGRLEGVGVALVKPQTYVNRSGDAVAPIARFYKIPPENVLVIYDDLDLPQGAIRFRPEGGSGGHNGMRSIIDRMGTRDFPRLRIGIGRPPGRMDPADYVLGNFTAGELGVMDGVFDLASGGIRCLLREGVEAAMSSYNRRGAQAEVTDD